jgi:exodeoxyribonuclease V alpha subunit
MGVPLDSVAIAAPTGKAAQRLAEAIALGLASRTNDIAQAALGATPLAPMTLHRLLGWSPASGRFLHHENNPLPYRVVIVDEASMIDLAMMDRLLRALAAEARLVLLGDADQLPSVEAGAVFRDLCAALGSSRLTTNLRVARDEGGRAIVAAATAVNTGVIGSTMARVTSPSALTLTGVELVDASWADAGDAFLDLWWRSRVATDDGFQRRAKRIYMLTAGAFGETDTAELRALFAHYATGRILCATRAQGAPASADAINESLMDRLRGPGSIRRAWRRPTDFAPGAPVMVQRNDYARNLFNGDQGVVVRVDGGDAGGVRSMAVFPRGDAFEPIPLDGNADLAPAFAMTVHKAQGSEFEHVALVLPHAPSRGSGNESEEPSAFLTRELVYTAITRARRSVVILSPWDLLTRAVSRTVQRHSGVAEKLAKKG